MTNSMKPGVCPDCEARVRRTMFKIYCDTCSCELEENQKTNVYRAGVVIVLGALMLYSGNQGTEEIIAVTPEESLISTLLLFYVQVWVSFGVLYWLVNTLISKTIATYKKPDRNT